MPRTRFFAGTARSIYWRMLVLIVALAAFGGGIALMVEAAVGISPWDVLAQGLARITGIEFGWMTILTGAGVLLLWIPLRQRPGVGTVLNAVLVGIAAQDFLDWVPSPTELWLQILCFAVGLVIVALATGAYIGVNLGPGPRDGLMTGLHARTKWPIWAIRTGIEVTVCAIGWALGGNVGFGTIAFALLIGPMVHVTLRWFTWPKPATAQAEPPEQPEPTAPIVEP